VFASSESVRVLDDRSANGTRVNGECVTGAELSDGDVILVGRVVLTYREFAES
jgi:pSer/pThr/pTyr-binding forkhead associated (FHA) protein